MTRFFQLRKTRSKAGLGAPQPLSGFLSCQPLLCQESRQQDLPDPPAVTRFTQCYYLRLWVVGQGGHPPTRYLVFPTWTTVDQRLLMPPTLGRPQVVHRAQTAFLSLCGSQKQRQIFRSMLKWVREKERRQENKSRIKGSTGGEIMK